MILADENIDFRIINTLRAKGHEVFSIYESKRGLKDEEIVIFSRSPQRIILTEDKNFGEWVFAHNIKDVSVIFLRYTFRETETMTEILTQSLSNGYDAFLGYFTTMTCKKIRRRKIR